MEYLKIDPVEELLRAIGIVHGHQREHVWRMIAFEYTRQVSALPPDERKRVIDFTRQALEELGCVQTLEGGTR